jgi:hypothetical protein
MKLGFLLLNGLIPRRKSAKTKKERRKEHRCFDGYFEVILEEMQQVYTEGEPLSSASESLLVCCIHIDFVRPPGI